MTLEEILKKEGWTDADIAASATLLQDARFRGAIEKRYGALETDLTSAKSLNDEWQRKLDTEYNPAIQAHETKAIEAQRESARLREEVRIAKEYGYLTPEAEAKAATAIAAADAASGPNAYDPKRHPTFEDVGKFAEAEAEAIALANDLSAEYSYLTGGQSLYQYETEINGVPMRGMRALRREALTARKPFDQYVSEKFDFRGKRQSLQAAKQKEHDDAIRKEASDTTRAELAQQYGNPMLRTAVPSRNALVLKPPENGKQPWEMTKTERHQRLVQNAMAVEMKGPAN